MKVYKHFRFTGRSQRWTVPAGVTAALFECWGAGGGMASWLHWAGKKNQVVGGTSNPNITFYNSPHPGAENDLGDSYSNNAGYVRGTRTVSEGQQYWVYVGGNGHPGHSSIRLLSDGASYTIKTSGGAGGYNGGGDGGRGAHFHQNLYNSSSSSVTYKRTTIPPKAKINQLWWDTDAHVVKKCNHTYTSAPSNSYWDLQTDKHDHGVGPSGGGGGGATDIRFGGTGLNNRLLVAGGSGGSGGHHNVTGAWAWTLRAAGSTPKPPFGSDDLAHGHSGEDHTWASQINYLAGGWGLGGGGGHDGPKINGIVTADTGMASHGGSGGPASHQHATGVVPIAIYGSGGQGGLTATGGHRGTGGAGGTDGSSGTGGDGADAEGGFNDYCAGGGGGGGGYYGGGGGGMGFHGSSGAATFGGGGGGGSDYIGPLLNTAVMVGCARPPMGYSNSGTGADGHGGFARISYTATPTVKWKNVPVAVTGAATFAATFVYSPAITNGSGIGHYMIGTNTDATASTPTTTQTIMVTNSKLTEFTVNFVAPAVGATERIYVQVVDLEGDASDWHPLKITGIAAAESNTATITSPTAGAQFSQSATVTWTVGTQTPLVAYKLAVTGNQLSTGHAVKVQSNWRRGGSRVNMAPDPGFKGISVWKTKSNIPLISETGHPGVSGSNGIVKWRRTTDRSAEQHTINIDNLEPDTPYRCSVKLASFTANDQRLYMLQAWDTEDNMINSVIVSLVANAAGVYSTVELRFVPHTEGVYFVLVPSTTSYDPATDPLLTVDFEDGTTNSFSTGTNSAVQSNSGSQALKTTASSARVITSSLTGAGLYIAKVWLYAPTGVVTEGSVTITGSGVTGTSAGGPLALPVAFNLAKGSQWSNTTYWGTQESNITVTAGDVVSGRTSTRATAATGISNNYIQLTPNGLSVPSGSYAWVCSDFFASSTFDTSTYQPSFAFGRDDTNNDSAAVDFLTAQGPGNLPLNAWTTQWCKMYVHPSRTLQRVYLRCIKTTGGIPAVGTYIQVNNFGVFPTTADSTSPPTLPVGFFDGSSTPPAGYIASWDGTTNASTSTLSEKTIRDAWTEVRVPFTWDGTSTVTLNVTGDSGTGLYWDDVEIRKVLTDYADFGNTDSGQINYLADMLLELAYEEDQTLGLPTYFDGTNANGNTGSVSWSGPLYSSPSILTGTDVLTGTIAYTGKRLTSGAILLDTLKTTAAVSGFTGSETSVAVNVNPATPAAATVTMEVNSLTGLMKLVINAADGAATYKTVRFDILRSDVGRIAKDLTPDLTTRLFTFYDAPPIGLSVSYTVRAYDHGGGYTDQTNGTVTLVS